MSPLKLLQLIVPIIPLASCTLHVVLWNILDRKASLSIVTTCMPCVLSFYIRFHDIVCTLREYKHLIIISTSIDYAGSCEQNSVGRGTRAAQCVPDQERSLMLNGYPARNPKNFDHATISSSGRGI